MANRKNTFLIKRSNVAGKVPAAGDLFLGELALNTADNILYASGTTANSILPIGWDRVARTGDTMTGGLFTPYLSATTISATSINKVDYIVFNTGTTSAATEAGTVYFDNTEKTLSYNTSINQGVTVNLGQQNYIRVFNNTGIDIPRGKCLELLSAYSGLPSVTLAINKHEGFNIIGVSSEIIPNNSEGIAITYGIISDIELTGMSVGSLIYASDKIPGELDDSSKYLDFPLTARTNSVGYVVQTGATIGKLFVNINNENSALSLTDLERNVLEGNTLSSGVFEYTGMTKTSSTTFNISPLKGWIVNNTYENALKPNVIGISYSGVTGQTTPYLLTDVATYVLVNSASTLTLINTFPTPQQRRENIFLGRVAHPDKTTIVTVNNTVDYDVCPMSSLRDLWTPLKLINENVIISPNGTNLSFNSSSGTLWGNGIGWSENQLNPNTVNITGSTPTTFQYRVQTGGTYTDTTSIDPAYYDLNGVRTLVGGGSNSSTNQRIYLYPNRQYRIQYGQKVYSNLAEAIVGTQTESFVTFVNNRDNAILIGILSVNKNASSLNNTGEAVFSFVSKFGELLGGTGGISTTTLQQAYDNSSQPEIVINSILDGLSIKNGTGNADNVTRLLEGQTATNGVTSFIRADGYISGTTFQSNGFIANSNGLTATTVSATTYQNLPIDIYTTGGTYTSGNATFTNNTGGTFNVTGFNTGDTTLYWYAENATPPTTTPIATGVGSIALGDGAEALGGDMFVYGGGAGYQATDANNSNFFGPSAGYLATGASNSNFFGVNAGNNATNAYNSNFFGYYAGDGATGAYQSNFIGLNAGNGTPDAYQSNFMGVNAGQAANNANNSNFFGNQAGNGATDANNSNFLGASAGYGATNAYYSNFFGESGGYQATNANNSNFMGYAAGYQATSAHDSNFMGYVAGENATNAYKSNFFGYFAGNGSTGAYHSNFFGNLAGYGATDANNSNFFGNGAGSGAINATYSNFFGVYTGYYASGAYSSNFFGNEAGFQATSAYNSNFFGTQAGYGASGANASNFFGFIAGSDADNANFSNFFGEYAGFGATNAQYSNFFGPSAGNLATDAYASNFFGAGAGYNATNASDSNFFGQSAGIGATEASNSNLFGYQAGKTFTDNNIGSNNIIIGTNITLPSGATDSLNIGGVLFGINTYNSIIGDPSITPNNGKIGINVVTPTEALHVSGNTLIEGTLSAITYLNLPTDTLQQAYTASTAPRIITNNDLGAFRVQNGTGTDTNINLAIENNAGDVTGYWDGNGDLVANIISGDTINASGDINGYSLVSTQSINDEGGELRLATPQTNTTISGSQINVDIYQNRFRIFESGGSNRGVYIDLTAAATGVGTNLLSGGGGEVNTASNLGSGAGLYAQKVAADLEFKSLTSTGGTVNISSNSTTVNLEVIPASNFTGGTVTGGTIFTNGLTANTISATTYLNLPTIITNVVNLITVGLSGSTGVDYNSIKTAVDSITDSSESNRYLVSVGPGTYVEGEIDLSTKPYVSIEGSNIISTQVIPSGSTQHIFKLGQNNELSFLALFGAPTGYAGIYVYDVGDYAQAHKVSFTDCDINVWVESNSQDTVFFGEYLDFNGSYSYGIKAIGNNGYEALANMENYYNYPSGTGVTICNYAQGSGATLNIFVGDNSSNGVSGTTAYLLEDGAQLNTTTITLDGFTYGIRNANVGSPVSFDIDNVSSVNCEWDLYIENPFTTGTFGGSANHEKIYNVSENIAWAFLDINDGEFDITRKISVTFQDGSHTDLSTLVFKGGTMGVISGGTLTNVSGTTIETSAGFGYLEKSDNSGIVRRIDWGNTQINLSANTNNYLFFNENSLLSSSGTAPKDTHNIILGRVVTDSTSVSFIDSTPVNADHTSNRFSSLFREGLGPIYAFGSIVTENTTPFKIDVSAGEYYFSTNEILPSGGTEVSFTQYYRDGIGGWNTSATTFVNNTHYDGNGSLSALTASAYTKHTLYLVGDGSNEKYFLVLGQNEYPTLVQAEDALLPTPPTFFNDSVVQIANIYIREGFSGITQFEDIRPVIGFKAGGVNASSLHANLLGLASDDHTQYLLADGDRSMSGNLNMGTNNITNVGTVDGVTVSSHAGRHLPNGLDPLTTSTPIDISTSNQIGIANALARSDHQHALGSNIVNDSNISAHTSTKITIIDKTLLNPYIIYSDQVISGLTATTISATTVNVDNINTNSFSANIISGTTLYGDGSNITNIAIPYGIINAMASGNFLT